MTEPIVAGSLAFTESVVLERAAHEIREVADYLRALCARAPIAGRDGWAAHQYILGAFAYDLAGITAALGEAPDEDVAAEIVAHIERILDEAARHRLADEERIEQDFPRGALARRLMAEHAQAVEETRRAVASESRGG